MRNPQRLLEPAATPAQQPERDRDPAVRRLQRIGWVTVRELSEDLRFTVTAPADPEKACREWLRTEGIPSVKRGRIVLVSSLDIERALRKV